MASWHYQSMGEIIGPVTQRELQQAAVQGKIQSDSLVRSANSKVWVSADCIAVFFDAKGLAIDSNKDFAIASWYFQSMGEVIGPVTMQQLQQAAVQGKIQSDSLVRGANFTIWVSANRIPGVFDAKGLPVDDGEHEEFFMPFYHWLKEVFSGRDPDGAIVLCVSAFGILALSIVSATGGFSGGDHQPSSRNITGRPSDMSAADYDYVSDRFRKEGYSEQDVDIATRAVNNAVKDRQNSRRYEDSSRYDSYDE